MLTTETYCSQENSCTRISNLRLDTRPIERWLQSISYTHPSTAKEMVPADDGFTRYVSRPKLRKGVERGVADWLCLLEWIRQCVWGTHPALAFFLAEGLTARMCQCLLAKVYAF